MPGGYSEAASRVLTMLEETWQAIRARHPEIPPVVIIIASGTTGRDARWGHFDPQRWTIHTTVTRILLIQTRLGVVREVHHRLDVLVNGNGNFS